MMSLSDRVPKVTSSSVDTSSSDDSSTSSSSPIMETGTISISGNRPSTAVVSSSPSHSPIKSSSTTTTSPTKSKTNLMTQSTIYRRHEARLARSYALRDDPRPAFLWVLSGLPGFRTIVPPYQQQSSSTDGEVGQKQRQVQVQAIVTTKPGIGTYSEETLFTPYSDAADNTISPDLPVGRDGDINNDNSGTLTSERAMQAMLATGLCSGVAQYMLGYYNNEIATRAYPTSSSSPFRNSVVIGPNTTMTATLSAQHSPLFLRQEAVAVSDVAAFGVYKRSAHEIPNANNNNALKTTTRPSTDALVTALSTSFSTSLLFGTKVFLDATMENQRHEHYMDHSRPTTSSILSSAISGAVVGLSRLAYLQVQQRQSQSQSQPLSLSFVQQQQQLNSSYSLSLIGRNVLAAILYFSIYEGVSSISSSSSRALVDFHHQRSNTDTNNFPSTSTNGGSSSSSSEKKGTMNILTGGALAGVAHVATMNYHRCGHYGSTVLWCTRAVPIHALVFYGYERMKEGVKIV